MEHNHELICQSCAMPLTDESKYGTNADHSKTSEYCSFCFQEGKFTMDVRMNELIEFLIPMCSEAFGSEEIARNVMSETFPKLNRWSK